MKKTLLPVLLLSLLIYAAPAAWAAVPSPETGAPASLQSWEAWVLHGYEEAYLCPADRHTGRYYCAWPISLSLDLNGSGGRFTAAFELKKDAFLQLPGGPGAWPEQVRLADGRLTPVLGTTRPQVWLPAGTHSLNGLFVWPELPETLDLPLGFTLDIKVDGRALDFPATESDYPAGRLRLWLKSRNAAESLPLEADAADSLKVTVNRLIQDSQPQMIKSRLKLVVGGRPREVYLNNALLPETKATSLSSPLPAQLIDGSLRIRVKPGTYEITLDSRSLKAEGDALGPAPEGDEPEFWAFQAVDKLRLVEVSGAEQIDPSQADVYQKWRAFPVYYLPPGDSLKFNMIRRGDAEPAPDDLSLNRECWLDYNGGGLSCRDQLSGNLRRQWHLNVSQPFTLAQASLSGQPQVITWQTDSKGQEAPGLQLRNGRIDLSADLRLDNFKGKLPASGWDHELTARSQKINLPPGYRVFHVSGADARQGGYGYGSGTWTSAWGTLDFFIVLIIAIATWKLFGLKYGLLALVTMVLCYHEVMAPRMVFLHLLACAALLRIMLKAGKAKFLVRSWRFLAALTLVVLASLFFINQVRIALYPQLENPSLGYGSYNLVKMPMLGGASRAYSPAADYGRDYYDTQAAEVYEAMPEPETTQNMVNRMMLADEKTLETPAAAQVPPPSLSPGGGEMDGSLRSKSRVAAKPMSKQELAKDDLYANRMVRLSQSPDAKVQNSVPRPQWNWRSVYLQYNNIITADQEVSIYFLSPFMGRVLALVRIALMAALVLMMLKPVKSSKMDEDSAAPQETAFGKAAAATALALVMTVALFLTPARLAAQTDFPSQELLDEYRQRLLGSKGVFEPGVPLLRIEASAESLVMEFEVETQEESIIGLPTLDKEVFRPETISVDGRALPLMEADGRWLALLPEGHSRVRLAGRLRKPAPKAFQINFHQAQRPQRTVVSDHGFWKVEGLEADGQLVGSALYLSPNGETPASEGQSEEEIQLAIDPFFLVHRTVSLGLQWQVHTSVQRITPAGSPTSLRLPLLPGENPISAGFRRDDQKLTLNFGPNDTTLSWDSSLETADELKLSASEGPWTESWSLDVSPIWRVKLDGPPPVQNMVNGFWQPQWLPWPGETLSLSVDRPQPVPGQYLVIDSARLESTIGEHNRLNNLNFQVRTSQGGPWSFNLPSRAKVREFTVNGKTMPLGSGAAEAGAAASPSGGPISLTASLTSGSHKINVVWTEDLPLGKISATPELNLGVPTANISTTLNLPQDRWILWAWGPVQGPAVQFWPLLAVVLLAAFILRKSDTPLKTGGWFLLGLGLIQLNIFGALFVAGWLLLLSRRQKSPFAGPGAFNAWQVVLVLWTLTALVLIYKGIQHGLLQNPDMLIDGGGSYGQRLTWFNDRSEGPWPVGRTLTVSLWFYKALMLAWSLWLAISLIKWLIWGWEAFSSQTLWKKSPPKTPRPMNQFEKKRAEALAARQQTSQEKDEGEQS